MARRLGFVLLLVLGGCRACSPSSPTTEAAAAATAGGDEATSGWAPLRAENVTPGPMATVIPPTCDQPTHEVCNAIDDDCAGAIDEGCGYGTGQLQITAAWGPPVDIDLYVTVPSGDIVSYQSPTTFDGGLLDRTSRGRCESPSMAFDTPPVATSGASGTSTNPPPSSPGQTSEPSGAAASTGAAIAGAAATAGVPAAAPRSEVPNIENLVYTSRPAVGHYVVELHYWGECMTGAGAVDVVVGVSVGGTTVGSYRITLTPNEREVVVSFDLR